MLKLSPHQHSFKLKPHHHTSYGPLLLVTLMVGILLSALTVSSFAHASPGPSAGSVGLTGIMPEKAPTTGATITTPSNRQQFATTPITVAGSCPPNTLVEIFKNNIFAGAAPCQGNGSYSLQIDLLYGANNLTAVVYDALNQAGPTSNGVAVTYTAQAPPTDLLANINFTGTQLLLQTDAIYRGLSPGVSFTLPIKILGGAGPFAINIEWGDNTNQIIPSPTNATVNASHTYARPGTYRIVIEGSDSQGRVAFLQIAAIVNGQPGLAASTKGGPPTTSKLLVLWPLYTIAATMAVSFWLGERREKHVLGDRLKPGPRLGPPTPHSA